MTRLKQREARALGLRFFQSPRPCKRCGGFERYASSRNCPACLSVHQRTNARKHNASCRAWAVRNSDKDAAAKKAWKKCNVGKVRAHARKRQTDKLLRTPAWADLKRIEIVYAVAKQWERELGVPMDVDHVVPLRGKRVSGLHVHENMQILPRDVHKRKGNKFEVSE